jgi:hypothetical protein
MEPCVENCKVEHIPNMMDNLEYHKIKCVTNLGRFVLHPYTFSYNFSIRNFVKIRPALLKLFGLRNLIGSQQGC